MAGAASASRSSITHPVRRSRYARAAPIAETSSPATGISLSAIPARGAPPTIGETPTTGPLRAATASRTPGTTRMGPIDTTGFDGHSSSDVGARRSRRGPRERGPRARCLRTGSPSPGPPRGAAPSTPGSGGRAARPRRSITSMRVVTASSVIGTTDIVRPNSVAHSSRGGLARGVRPSWRSCVRNTCVARSRSPRLNQASTRPDARIASIAWNVSPARPHPRSRSIRSASQ